MVFWYFCYDNCLQEHPYSVASFFWLFIVFASMTAAVFVMGTTVKGIQKQKAQYKTKLEIKIENEADIETETEIETEIVTEIHTENKRPQTQLALKTIRSGIQTYASITLAQNLGPLQIHLFFVKSTLILHISSDKKTIKFAKQQQFTKRGI